MYKFINISKARTCADPSNNLSLAQQTYTSGPTSPGKSNQGSIWTIQCITGYRWINNYLKNITCLISGLWDFPEVCQGKKNSY